MSLFWPFQRRTPVVATPPRPPWPTCRRCGHHHRTIAKFCPVCGLKFSEACLVPESDIRTTPSGIVVNIPTVPWPTAERARARKKGVA